MTYYEGCAFPKPGKTRKKKKKQNGWKEKPNRICAYCGKPYAERHELFGGANRQISIDYGFQIDLCRDHHEKFHRCEGEWAEEVKRLRGECQFRFETRNIKAGLTPAQAHAEWMRLIGKSYL